LGKGLTTPIIKSQLVLNVKLETLKGRDNMEDLGIDGRIILE
jgi:hypothetical protein